MATRSRKSCALSGFLGFERPDDDSDQQLAPTGLDKNPFACFCMRPTLPGELYEIFALPGVLYENLALITGQCMEYTLACIWCYYYDDGLEVRMQSVIH